jgi:aspartyl-tRNA(Asn)/glutamyl-tRNA(Gln) amidotransferase subunit A
LELYRYTIGELQEKLRNKEVSAVEITKSVFKRIDAVDAKVKAYITRTDELALAQAEAVDKEIKNGNTPSPLAGIAGGITDAVCTKGVKTTCAAKTLADFTPPYNAFVIDKLAGQGLVMAGKTNLDEFSLGNSTELSAYSPSANPWSLDKIPGGDAAAAAVAAGEAIWALGSDDSGALRQAAAYCGLVGLKPTFGLVSRLGYIAATSSLGQIGPLTRSVADCALVLSAIAGYDAQDSLSLDRTVPNYSAALKKDAAGLKIGIPQEYFADNLDEEVKTAVFKAIEDLKALGATCVEVSLPHTKYALAAHYLLACAEASSNLACYDGVGFGYRSAALASSDNIHAMISKSRSESFGDEAKRRIILGT